MEYLHQFLHFVHHNEALWWVAGVATVSLVTMFPAARWQKKQDWYQGT